MMHEILLPGPGPMFVQSRDVLPLSYSRSPTFASIQGNVIASELYNTNLGG